MGQRFAQRSCRLQGPEELGESAKSWYDGKSEGSSALLFADDDCPKPYTSYLDIVIEEYLNLLAKGT